jgi:hypothetical protein
MTKQTKEQFIEAKKAEGWRYFKRSGKFKPDYLQSKDRTIRFIFSNSKKFAGSCMEIRKPFLKADYYLYFQTFYLRAE